MVESCDNKDLYQRIVSLLQKLDNGRSLSAPEERKMRVLLTQYCATACIQEECTPNTCWWKGRTELAEKYGYENVKDILYHFEFQDPQLQLKLSKKPITKKGPVGGDALDAPRRPGHFNG